MIVDESNVVISLSPIRALLIGIHRPLENNKGTLKRIFIYMLSLFNCHTVLDDWYCFCSLHFVTLSNVLTPPRYHSKMSCIPVVRQPHHRDTRTTPADPDRAALSTQTLKAPMGKLLLRQEVCMRGADRRTCAV